MKRRLGEQLVVDGVIAEEQLQQGLRLLAQLGGRIGTNLVEIGALTEDQLLTALGKHRGTRTASRQQLENISPAVIRLLPAKLAKRYQLVPYELQGKTLLIASADVVDAITEDEIRMLTGHMVRTAVALELRLKLALYRYYRVPYEVRFSSLAKRMETGTLLRPKPLTPAPPAPPPVEEDATSQTPSFARRAPRPSIPPPPTAPPPTAPPPTAPPPAPPLTTTDGPAESTPRRPTFARKEPPPPIPPLPNALGEAPPADPPRPPGASPLRTLEPISAMIPLPELDEHGRPRLPKIQSKSKERPLFIELDDDDAELLRSMRDTSETPAETPDTPPTGEELPQETSQATLRHAVGEKVEEEAQEEVQETVSAPAVDRPQPYWQRRPGIDTPTEEAPPSVSGETAVPESFPVEPPSPPSHPDAEATEEAVESWAESVADGPPAESLYQEPSLDDGDLSLEERLDLATAMLQDADIRDEIGDVLLRFAAPYFERRLLLFRRQEKIVGWRGEGRGIKAPAVRAIAIDKLEPSVFLSLTESSSLWRGPLPPLEPNQRLIAGLGGAPPKDCLVLPVVLRSKTVCYFYGDNRQDGVASAPMAELRRLLAKASIAFEVYILKNKMRLL